MFNDEERDNLPDNEPATATETPETELSAGMDESEVTELSAGTDEAEAAGTPEPLAASFDDDHAVLYEKQDGPIAPEPAYVAPVREYSPDNGWSEPRYESLSSDPEAYTPGVGTGFVVPEPVQPVIKEKKKNGHPFLRACAIILACALFSSLASWATVSFVLANSDLGPREVVLHTSGSRLTTDVPGDSTPVSYEGPLSASTIYKNACNYQVVGVNTSVNTRNIFGQTTSRAVSGSGFVISSDGYILTNYHVISYAVRYNGKLSVLFENGTAVDATVVGYSEDNDVAVIRISTNGLTLNPVTLGDSDALEVGESVYAIGNPLGELTYTMTPGIVSALDRLITTTDEDTGVSKTINMFQISAAVNSGNSGGPVYNAYGEVVGIVTAKYAEEGVEGLGFAIPIKDAVDIATILIEKGEIKGAALGITVSNTLPDASDNYNASAMQIYGIPNGAVVYEVIEGGPAEKAGIHPNDIITAINGTKVSGFSDLKRVLRSTAPGSAGTVTVYRPGNRLGSGTTLTLDIVFGEAESASPSTDEDVNTGRGNSDNSGSSFGDTFPGSGR